MKAFILTIALLLVALLTSVQAQGESRDSESHEDVHDSDELKFSSEDEVRIRRRLIKLSAGSEDDDVRHLATLSRTKRSICTALSNPSNKSPCTLHCVIRGYKGGWCTSTALCICRN